MTDLEDNLRRMYRLISEQVGKPPRLFRCAPCEVGRMQAAVQQLALPLTVEADEDCDENLGYYVEPQ